MDLLVTMLGAVIAYAALNLSKPLLGIVQRSIEIRLAIRARTRFAKIAIQDRYKPIHDDCYLSPSDYMNWCEARYALKYHRHLMTERSIQNLMIVDAEAKSIHAKNWRKQMESKID